jgi:hypothetical protein
MSSWRLCYGPATLIMLLSCTKHAQLETVLWTSNSDHAVILYQTSTAGDCAVDQQLWSCCYPVLNTHSWRLCCGPAILIMLLSCTKHVSFLLRSYSVVHCVNEYASLPRLWDMGWLGSFLNVVLSGSLTHRGCTLTMSTVPDNKKYTSSLNLNILLCGVSMVILICCIRRGPGGERIIDIVPRGTELELKLRREVGQATHTCSKLGRPHTLAISWAGRTHLQEVGQAAHTSNKLGRPHTLATSWAGRTHLQEVGQAAHTCNKLGRPHTCNNSRVKSIEVY